MVHHLRKKDVLQNMTYYSKDNWCDPNYRQTKRVVYFCNQFPRHTACAWNHPQIIVLMWSRRSIESIAHKKNCAVKQAKWCFNDHTPCTASVALTAMYEVEYRIQTFTHFQTAFFSHPFYSVAVCWKTSHATHCTAVKTVLNIKEH